MHTIRCLNCGSSRLDPERYKCARCGGSPGRRNEPCYISEETKRKLLRHADELSEFGLKFERQTVIVKNWHFGPGDAIALLEAVRPGTLRALLRRLRALAIPAEEILRLRLGEPELILNYYRMDEKFSSGAVVWKGPAPTPVRPVKLALPSKRNPGRLKKKVTAAAGTKPKLRKLRSKKKKS
jgi:hypothetical protein